MALAKRAIACGPLAEADLVSNKELARKVALWKGARGLRSTPSGKQHACPGRSTFTRLAHNLYLVGHIDAERILHEFTFWFTLNSLHQRHSRNLAFSQLWSRCFLLSWDLLLVFGRIVFRMVIPHVLPLPCQVFGGAGGQ